MLSVKGCATAQTTRMLAQKQPHIKRVRNSSLVEWLCAENVTGLSIQPKLGLLEVRNEKLEVRRGNRMIQSYRQLRVYERSYALAVQLYHETKKLPEEERFGLISQIKRAATSIPLNIAEGYGKKQSTAEFKRYLLMSLGSCNEMQVLLDLCKDLNYISEEKHTQYYNEYDEIGRMLNVMVSRWK